MFSSTLTRATSLVEAFGAAVDRHADRVAVRCDGRSVSYRELDEMSAALAAVLRSRAESPGLVGILLDRSTDMITAAIATLKAGMSYVPLDPESPAARLAVILEDAAPAIVLTSRKLAGLLPQGVPTLLMDEPLPAAAPASTPAPFSERAYVIFTSGTTGRPKGVEVTHHNVLRLLGSTEELYGFGPDDVWSMFHSFAFDVSVWEMWGALLYGGCVVVVPQHIARDPAAFRQLLRDERVTVLSQTPTAFRSLQAEESRWADRLGLNWVIFAGEALHFPDLARWVSRYGDAQPQLINMYGITETTVHSSFRRVLEADLSQTQSLIGEPLPDLDFVLADENLNPVPAGEVGEIIVTGPGVAMGYLGRPELTRERFVELTGPDGATVRGYRSGDLARLTPAGDHEYHGRKDDQVKIRGYRIELNEIRAILSDVPGVRETVVTVHKATPATNPVLKQRSVSTQIAGVRDLVRGGEQSRRPGDATPKIVGYVVTDDDFDAGDMFRHLRAHLPSYMIPTFVVPVAAVPMNHNGKVDKAKLPTPSVTNCLREPRQSTSDASDAGVLAICAAFEEALGVSGVSPDDPFFQIGGDSILAVNLRAVALRLGFSLEVADIYALQTPRALAGAHGHSDRSTSDPVEPFSLITPADQALLASRNVEDAYPLAALQAGVLFHSAYESGVNMYCDIFMFRLRAEFDQDAMARAIDRAADRHDILRTSFDVSGFSEPLQLVHPSAVSEFTVTDFSGLSTDEQNAELEAWRIREIRKPYDWARPPLARFAAHILGDQEFMFSMSFHDALLDGWSETSLFAEILVDYWALRGGDDKPATPRPARRYADFIAMELDALRDDEVREFWEDELAEAEPTMLPWLALGSADVHDGRMGFLSAEVEPDLSARLDELAGERGVSLKHVLIAVHARVMATLAGQDEVVLGVLSNGRVEDDGGTDVLGVHLNLVPHRFRIRDKSWGELIGDARAKEGELLSVRRFPHAELLRMTGLRELTDTMFNYTHFHSYERLARSTDIKVLDGKGYVHTNFTLRIEFNKDPFSKLLMLDLEANMERVGEDQLRQIAELYQAALANVVADVQHVPRQRELLGEERWQELLALSTGPVQPPTAPSYFALFDRAVAEHGNAVAAICGQDSLTYKDLAARVDAMAGWLAQRGVQTGTVTGIVAGRDLDYLVTTLAILRTGAVYLPLPQGPALRVASMLRRSGAEVVLCDKLFRPGVEDAGVEVLDLEQALAEADGHEPYAGPVPKPQDSAYILFTSGSTGEPKGALIRHDGLLNHVEAKIEALGLRPGDRMSQDAAATFDISIWQWLAPLAVGATTVIYPDEIGQDASRLLRAVAEDGVTAIEVTPSVLSVFNAELTYYGVESFPEFALRWVVSQAETLTPQCANTFRRLLPGVRVLNMWGATEVSDDATHHEIVGEVDERIASVPIGMPLRNLSVYVLDANRELVPIGTPGDVYVGGLGVCAGYINDPDRTAKSFVPDPFVAGATMYRTGDRCRRLADGSLEFLGRVDNQLKIRGNRIELGEVTNALAGLTEVQDSAVIVRDSGNGRQLVGFFVPQVLEGQPEAGPVTRINLAPAHVRAGLAKLLPRFAVPDVLIRLEKLPRTTHGKVDTRALADWDINAELASGPAADDRPVTATEAIVADAWAAVLQIDRPGPAAGFFDLGGHSLHATQVMARLREHFGLSLPIRVLFDHPTVRELAAQIDASAGQDDNSLARIPARPAGMTELPLTFNQSSLWYLNEADPDDRGYENAYLLRLSGPLDVEALRFAIDTLIERHEVLSTRFASRGGIPYQTQGPRPALEIETVDVPVADKISYARVRLDEHRFDLAQGPLTIARLYRFSVSEHVLAWSTNHAVSDGWSNELVINEIRTAYQARLEGQEPELPALPHQYGDYARWQHEFLSSSAEDQLRFWKSYLDGYAGELNLLTDFDRSPDRSRAAAYATRTWPESMSARISAHSHDRRTTPFMLFHAVTTVLLAKFTQQSDVVIGAAVAGRGVPGTEHLVGYFANTLPFRYDVDLDRTPDELLSSVASSALTALEHQLVPFQRIVEASGVGRRPGVAPLVQVAVTVETFDADAAVLPGLSCEIEQVPTATSLYDLMFRFTGAKQAALTVQYDASLFAERTIDWLVTAYDRLLSFFLDHPDRPLRTAALLDEHERHTLEQIWHDLTGSRVAFDGSATAAVLDSPHWPAFVDLVEERGLLPALVMAL